MGKINLARVFLGGMAAGIFAVALQSVAFVLGVYHRLGEAAGLPLGEAPLSSQLTIAALEVFVGGPLAIWLYAAIRPRFGAGPRTAILTGTYIWLILVPYGGTILAVSGLLARLPMQVLVAINVASFPLVLAAVMVGAWIYQEE